MTPSSAPGADPLAALKPIQLPAEPGWWPPAPGWWLLALAIVLALITAVLLWHRWQRIRAPRLQAENELEQIRMEQDPVRQLTAINQLLRRAAKAAFGPTAASLPPAQWSQFLVEHAAPEHRDITPWQQLAEAPYRNAPAAPADYLSMSQAWLRKNLKRTHSC